MPARHPGQIPAVDRPAVEKQLDRIDQRSDEWRPNLAPKGVVQEWLFKQVVVNSVLVDLYQSEMLDLKPRLAERARLQWDQDRADEVEKLSRRLSKKPSQVAAQLRRTSQGCDWLIGRWEMLAGIADWGPEQRSLAFDLMGTPVELRDREPWADGSGPAELAREQIAALVEHRDGPAAALDAFEREDAERGLETRPVPALDRLRRRESSAFRRFQWAMEQLQSGATPELPESERPAEPQEPSEAECLEAEQIFWQKFLASDAPLPFAPGTSAPEILSQIYGGEETERVPSPSVREERRNPGPNAAVQDQPMNRRQRRAMRSLERRAGGVRTKN